MFMTQIGKAIDKNSFKPVLSGTVPDKGSHWVIFNLRAYSMNFPKDSKFFSEFWWDGDAKRPILIADNVDATRINTLLRKYGKHMQVITIMKKGGTVVYTKADTQIALDFCNEWIMKYGELSQA